MLDIAVWGFNISYIKDTSTNLFEAQQPFKRTIDRGTQLEFRVLSSYLFLLMHISIFLF